LSKASLQQEEYQAAKQQLAAIQNKELAQEQQRQASEKFLSEGGKLLENVAS